MTVIRNRKPLGGSIDAPPSKSLMQRALACATLAGGTSMIRGGPLCADSRAALGVAKALGAEVEESGSFIRLSGSPLFEASASLFRKPSAASWRPAASPGHPAAFSKRPVELDCGESGLCMRMFSPIATLLSWELKLLASGSLASRPMSMVEEPLRRLGASCSTQDGRPPITVQGPLRGGRLQLDAAGSSQFITGLLLALPLADGNSEIDVEGTVSKGYLDLTIQTAGAFGVLIQRDSEYSRFMIPGSQAYRATDFTVEGDWSAAAFLVVAAALGAGSKGIVIKGLYKDSFQPDRAVLDAAALAGTPFEFVDGELRVGKAALRPFEFDATNCPDLFPPLAALAAACPGLSTIQGTGRLKSKESDRAASIKAMLESLGIKAELQKDSLLIHGGKPSGGDVESWGDHRIAMAAAVAALACDSEIHISGAECVAKSWPGFFEDMDSLILA